MSQRSQRKEEHLALAKMFFNKKISSDFDQIHLLRPALPESKYDQTSIKSNFFKTKISAPIFINAMTGGSDQSYNINKILAQASAKTKIPMALGSASILEKEPEQLKSFYIARKENPEGFLLANVNPNTSPKTVKEIIDNLQANALQIHLNTVQEAVMPEGDRNFYWLENLRAIKEAVNVPVIIKEVGQGLDTQSISTLQKAGFDYFDLGGSGGTDFAKIENSRRNNNRLAFLEELNISTPKALLAVHESTISPKALFASGGIRNSLDIFKALVLGANSVGLASHFLEYAYQGKAALINEIEEIKKQLVMLTALFGLKNINEASKIKFYLDPELYLFQKQLK